MHSPCHVSPRQGPRQGQPHSPLHDTTTIIIAIRSPATPFSFIQQRDHGFHGRSRHRGHSPTVAGRCFEGGQRRKQGGRDGVGGSRGCGGENSSSQAGGVGG